MLMDDWHKSAANADMMEYFKLIADDGYFLGTQHDEIWTKDEFYIFCKPFFDKGKTWTFVPFERNVYISANGKAAWFDEKLETWMGICRGSGVMEIVNDSLKLKHYNLAVTISNDLVHDFVELVKADTINYYLLEE